MGQHSTKMEIFLSLQVSTLKVRLEGEIAQRVFSHAW